MGRDSVTESGRGMNPEAPLRNGRAGGPPGLGWREQRIHRGERRDRRALRKEADLPCDGSAFTASLRFT